MEFKYKATLDNISVACYPFGHKDFQVSKASLDELKKLSPNINLDDNPDLLGVSFNLAVPNMINHNGDGISGATAAKIAKRFMNKYLNIEHNKDRIVGHITNYSFNKFGTNEFMTEEEAAKTLDPFYLSVAGVVYKTVDKRFATLMTRNSDPADSFHNSISASWEIGFSKYYLAVGSDKLKEAEIIIDPGLIEKYSPFLKSKGGSGILSDGSTVNRVIVGDIYPLGGGFTTNPAAQVKGVVAFDYPITISLENDESTKEPLTESTDLDTKQKPTNTKSLPDYTDFNAIEAKELEEVHAFLSNKKINSILERKNVKTINHMDLEKLITELKSVLLEKKFGEEAVASMTSTFAEAIKQKDAEYRESLAAEKNLKEELMKKNEEAMAALEKMKCDLAATQEQLKKMQDEKEQDTCKANLIARVGELDAAYDLADEDRKLVISEVQALDNSEQSFASYKEKFAVVWKHKNKDFIKAQKDEFDKKVAEQVEARLKEVSKASVSAVTETKTQEAKADIEAALEGATATNKAPDSKISAEKSSFRDKFASAFSRENISVSYSK